jgi:tRNA pseudouridine38-40 synthase
MYNKKCVTEYDGTDFCGWQIQKNGRTVQEELENALGTMYKQEIKIIGSGRTDSGVHALNQVFSYRCEKHLDNRAVQLGLNSMLPDDVVIKSVEDADLEFHAQKSAVSKTYRYLLLCRPYRSALDARRTWWLKREPDKKLLTELFAAFEGEHDFASFCAAEGMKENTVRTVYSTKVYYEGEYTVLEINGSGFLHMMVRIIIGTLVSSTFRKKTPDYIRELIDKKDRNQAGMTAPACGLYLKEVFY